MPYYLWVAPPVRPRRLDPRPVEESASETAARLRRISTKHNRLEALWDTNGRDHWIVVDPGRGVPVSTSASGGNHEMLQGRRRLNSPSVSGVFASSGQIWRPAPTSFMAGCY